MKYDLFEEKLLEAGLNKEKFLELTEIPKTTFYNWSKKSTYSTPKWVEAFLEIYIKNRNNEIYISKLKEEIHNHE